MGFTSIETANRMAAVEKKRKQGGDVIGTLTLRDYFAAKAMQGFMANKANPMHFQPEDDAQWAYTIANAMLKAREQ